MSYTVNSFTHPSSDGKHTLTGVVYCPDGEARGYFQVVHGMCEHIGRYERFMSQMADEGWICFGYDHLGHGKTAADPSEFGYIADKKGYELLIDDVKRFADAVISKYTAEKGVNGPYVLMGHSMGSFIVRLATAKYKNPDKLIIMGTGGKNPLATPGIAIISMIKAFRGGHHISPLVQKLAFGNYTERFEGTDPSRWLSTNQERLSAFHEDKLSGFFFTVSAMKDLVRMNRDCNLGRWYKAMPTSLPVLLVSGEDDPVGNYSKGVLEVEKGLKKKGIPVKCVIYKGARHEILEDFTHDDVVRDILAFVE
ncbi:MAG: alpha/beta fold hydrolase [Clostridia bacterium]|nr:alpha/beta fold hydrolase [Clostridia bacterium]